MQGDDEDDEEGGYKVQTCVDCGATSPPIHTNYTLIGAHGWRVMRVKENSGMMPQWRCPTCFAAIKRRGK